MAEINDILTKTGRHFSDLLDKDANPLEVALSLMDNSSIGRAMYASEFEQLQHDLNQCLKQQVVANFQGFNTSTSLYHTLVNTCNNSHQTLVDLQDELATVRKCLKNRNPIVKEWQESSQQYAQALKLLDIAEQLKGVPDLYEGYISQKQFLEAHECLNNSLEIMLSNNMLKYPPIEQIHTYIIQQQLALADTIEKEIAAHLYLMSPYTFGRWQNHSVPHAKDDVLVSISQSDQYAFDTVSNLKSFLGRLSEPLEIDYSVSVETDSFIYIRLLVDILGKIGRLDQVAENIIAKVNISVRRLVEKTIGDFVKREKITIDSLLDLPTNIIAQLDSPQYRQRLRVLEALAATIYSKLGAVLEGHRVLYELIKGRVQYNILHVYAAIETEVHSLLTSYIATPPSAAAPSAIVAANRAANARRKSFGNDSRLSVPSKHYTKSEYSGPKFQFTPEAMDPEIQAEFDSLRISMKKWVPGIKFTAELDNGQFNPYAETHKETNLSVVVPANVLNIRALLALSATFMQLAHDVLDDEPQCVARIDKFLPEFLHKTYLPSFKAVVERYLDEVIEQHGTSIFEGYKQVSQYPLMTFGFKAVELIGRLGTVLNTTTYFRPEYVDILLMILEIIKEFVEYRIKEGVETSVGHHTKIIEQLSANKEVQELHRKLHSETSASWLEKDIALYLGRMANTERSQNRLQLHDLVDIDMFRMFTNLATTTEWVLSKVKKMGKYTENVQANMDSQLGNARRSWALVDDSTSSYVDVEEGHILLNGESYERFKELISSLEASNRHVLSLLRCDLMCRIIYHFDEMALKGSFDLQSDTEDVDTDIDLLQTNLATCHKIGSENLLPENAKFVFTGCAKLMNELFIKESVNISGIVNENGVRKMFSNILSLQQVLKSVVTEPQDVDFARAADFYESIKLTPVRTLDDVRNGKSKLQENDIILVLKLKLREEQARSRDHTTSIAHYNERVQQVRKLFSRSS